MRRLGYTPQLAFVLACAVLFCEMTKAAEDKCHDVLTETVVNSVDTMYKTVAIVHLIHSQADLDWARSAGGSISAVFEGLPLGAQYNSAAYNQWRSDFEKQDTFSLTDSEAHSLQESFIPTTQTGDWLACMTSAVHDAKLYLGVVNLADLPEDKQKVIVKIDYIPPTPLRGQKPMPATISRAREPEGGVLAEKWPELKVWEKPANTTVGFIRNRYTDLTIFALMRWEKNGDPDTEQLRIPGERRYATQWSTNMVDVFQSVMPGVDVPIPSTLLFKPGSQVNVTITRTTLRVDDGTPINWLTWSPGINDVSDPGRLVLGVDLNTGGGPPKTQGDITFTDSITVPWNGRIVTHLHLLRAEDSGGLLHSVSATGGILKIEALP